jgi:5-methylcytosine-specific restriction endonuclease McrA
MSTNKQTTYNSSNVVEKVWDLAKPMKGGDPDKYRKDPYGNVIYKQSYGKDTKMGWNIDHIKPQSKGGSDNIRNLQALQTEKNKSKGNSLVKKSRHSG